MPSDEDGRDDERGRGADSDFERGEQESPGPGSPSDPATASAPQTPPGEPGSFGDYLRDGWDRALDHLPLALVPLVSSLLAPDNVRRVLEFSGDWHLGLTFRFPSLLPDLWTFVSLPSQGPGVHVSSTLIALPVLILVRAALVAGLVGSAHEQLRTGEYDFAANAQEYFAPVLVFAALVHVAGFAAFSVGVAALPLVLLLFPLFVVLSYVFYATPYLLVVADLGVGDALGRSYEWAMTGGPYFSYGVSYLLFVAAVSLVATTVVVNLGAVGILVGAVASAPVALALTFATTAFVGDVADASDLDTSRGGS